MTTSLLPFVLAADNFPQHTGKYPTRHPVTNEQYTPFHLCASDLGAGVPPIGLLRPSVLLALMEEEGPECAYEFEREHGTNDIVCVAFAPAVLAKGKQAMNAAIAATARRWKDAGKFAEALDGE